jgi:NAD(P)-dependent dehydrogenase (short-subunit alcohol dehydrogenase family)
MTGTQAGVTQSTTRSGHALLDREVAIVTGASAGIGAATARALARRGARVVLAARRAERLDAQVAAITRAGGSALAVPTDVADPLQVEALVRRTLDVYERVDVLVNNVGGGAFAPLTLEPAEITRMIDANLTGAILLVRAVLPGMIERRHGAIIAVAAVTGAVALDPLYSATKFGLRGFTLSLRRQVAGSGVAVSVISPGYIQTDPAHRSRPLVPGPDAVARRIADLVAHPHREVFIPRFHRAAVWVEHALPWAWDLAIRSQVVQPSGASR